MNGSTTDVGMDARNVRSWLIGSALLSGIVIASSLLVRRSVSSMPGIETTFTWMLTSPAGILVQITLASIAMFVVVAIVDRN